MRRVKQLPLPYNDRRVPYVHRVLYMADQVLWLRDALGRDTPATDRLHGWLEPAFQSGALTRWVRLLRFEYRLRFGKEAPAPDEMQAQLEERKTRAQAEADNAG